jgi:hypothetical protein
MASTDRQTTPRSGSLRYRRRARIRGVCGSEPRSCGQAQICGRGSTAHGGCGQLRRRAHRRDTDNVRHLCASHRLTCADLPPGLTSHACLPACWPGGTLGLELNSARARVAQASGSAERLGAEQPDAGASNIAGKEGTRPWPSSLRDSSWRAVSTSGTRPAVGIQR